MSEGDPGRLGDTLPATARGGLSPGRGLLTLDPGDLVVGRYKILKFLAEGGMGEVYEVEDVELHERIALKTIRPEHARDEESIARFKREINLARRISHPNVCRVFDLGRHRDEGPGELTREIVFMTMELLHGETLATRLRDTGRMTEAEALPILAQLVAALDAAHDQGIVHRDFKSSNVFLVPDAAGSGGVRAVITDFGMARRGGGSSDSDTAITATGQAIGTPAYMAPEQLEGADVTPAADIYSLGIVMYEMLAATRPFQGDNPITIAIKRLKELPASPRVHVPGIDPRWEAAIMRCLEIEPAERFERASDVLKAVRGARVERAAGSRRRRRRAATAASLGVIVLVGAGLALIRIWTRPPPAPPALQLRRSVAVFGFRNVSGHADTQWLSTALSEMLSTELATGEKLRSVPGEKVAQTQRGLSIEDAGSLAPDTLARLRSILGADLVVLGSFVVISGQEGARIRVDTRLQDTSTGDTITVHSETGSQAALFDLVGRVGEHLRASLGLGSLTAEDAMWVRASVPSNAKAAALYAEGLERMHLFDWLAARDLLVKAAEVEPAFPLAHAALAQAWSKLGYDRESRQEAKKALDLSGGLRREARLLVEARHWEALGDWKAAAEIWRSLFVFFPDEVEYGLSLVIALINSGAMKDAAAIVATLQNFPSPSREDPRIALAALWIEITDADRRAQAADQVAKTAEAMGARLIVAEARWQQGMTYWRIGKSARARAAYEEARKIYQSAGNDSDAARVTNDIGVLLEYQGDLDGARKMFEEMAATSRRIGSIWGTAVGEVNASRVALQQADLDIASREMEDALNTLRMLGSERPVAGLMESLAELSRLRGDLHNARRVLAGLIKDPLAEGQVDPSETEALLRLAWVALDEGQEEEAVALAQRLQRAFIAWDENDGVTEASVLLALASESLGRHTEARRSADQALARSTESAMSSTRLLATIAAARVRAGSNNQADLEAAAGELKRALAGAERMNHVLLQFQARLAMGEVELRAGRVEEGRAMFMALERDAAARGVGLFARKAATARAGGTLTPGPGSGWGTGGRGPGLRQSRGADPGEAVPCETADLRADYADSSSIQPTSNLLLTLGSARSNLRHLRVKL
ncbi:MAG: protein kinase [Acidobacteria bacterium]|nr:protein kinase [Acidobacteriota bacterium]